MKIFEFNSAISTVRAFTLEASGRTLPGRRTHWRQSRAHDVPLGLLAGTEIGDALDRSGLYVTRPDECGRELLELLYQ